jgi:acetyl esterase
MPLAPEIAGLLDAMAEAGGPQIYEVPVPEARVMADRLIPLAGEGADIAGQVEREIGGVPSVVYTPHPKDGDERPFPVLVFIHGGGWVINGPQHYHPVCQDLAAGAGCVVVSIDYRMAPEFKAPVAVDDSIAAVGWVLDHAAEIGGDPSRVAVGGDSAGGNLSAVVAQHFAGRLAAQLLIYPAVDMTASFPSIQENAEGLFLTKQHMDWFQGHYVDGTGLDLKDPIVSPLYASDEVLAATAPAFVITAEYDPLRDEGEAYAAKLQSLGVATRLRRYDGMIHAFYVMKAATPSAVQAIDDSTAFLRDQFG